MKEYEYTNVFGEKSYKAFPVKKEYVSTGKGKIHLINMEGWDDVTMNACHNAFRAFYWCRNTLLFHYPLVFEVSVKRKTGEISIGLRIERCKEQGTLRLQIGGEKWDKGYIDGKEIIKRCIEIGKEIISGWIDDLDAIGETL